MEEFAEPSILEYARFHGVASSTLPSSDLLAYISPDTLESLESTLQDPSTGDFETKLSTAATHVKSKEKERLEIERDGAVFLSSIIKPTTQQPLLHPASTSRHRVKNMKIDPPILQSDHELDMRAFSHGVSVIPLDPSKLDLPLEQLEVENDEGIEWPRYYMDFPAQVWEMVRAEKLDCTREVLLFIQGVRDVRWDGVGGEEVVRVKKKVIELLTPPLLPLVPETEPFVPSSPAGRLEILSEPETPPVKEHVECEREVMEMDSLDVDDHRSNEEMLFEFVEFGDGDNPGVEESLTLKRSRGDDLKVEGPITPPISAKKRRAEEDKKPVAEILADNAPELLRQPHDVENSEGEILDEHLVEIARAAIDKVEARLNNECLRQVNPTTRVKVPSLDSSMIIPPWKATESLAELGSKDAQREFIGATMRDYLKVSSCPMERKAERSLEWVPFSLQKSYIDVDEGIETDGRLEIVQAPDVKDCEVTDGLLDRLGGLQILKDGDGSDEDELSPLDIIPETLHSSSNALEKSAPSENMCITGKKPEYSSRERKTKQDTGRDSGNPNECASKAKRPPQSTAPGVSIFQPGFSTMSSLTNFMEIRGQGMKRRKIENSPYFPTAEPEGEPHEPTRQQSPKQADNPPLTTTKEVESIPVLPLPSPDITPSTERLTLVLSTALLRSHRFVVHHLESMGTQHTLIFRDFDQFSQANKQQQQKQMHSNRYTDPTSRTIPEDDEDLGQEADIILSPSTAILLTTSQATTQLYLPGHSPRDTRKGAFDSPLRERIARTSLRYEQLYVLISHPSGSFNKSSVQTTPSIPPKPDEVEPTSITMDTRTADSIRSLISFCSSLSLLASVTPLVTPSEPPELLKWIMSLVFKHALQSSPIPEQQQEDETPPELFLRRAGLNPLAAQYILAMNDDGDSRCSKLATFVNMDPRERRRKFATVIGERLFSRVERRLEMGWDFV